MITAWRLLRYLPPGLLTFIKRHSGTRIRFWLRQKFGADYRGIPDQIFTTGDGRQFHIGPDYAYWTIYMGLGYEPEATNVLGRLLQPGDTVLDVGANFGWYTTLFARVVGCTGRVHAFEPVPITCERLRENVELNKLSTTATIVCSAVGEGRGHAAVHLFKNLSHYCASLSPLNETEYDVIDVPVVSLDEYVNQNLLTRVDFMKCDVEGSELAVLNGARQLLSSQEAPIVLVELNEDTSRAFGFGKTAIWDFLRGVGYDHFLEIASTGTLRPVRTANDLKPLDLLLCAKGLVVEQRLRISD